MPISSNNGFIKLNQTTQSYNSVIQLSHTTKLYNSVIQLSYTTHLITLYPMQKVSFSKAYLSATK